MKFEEALKLARSGQKVQLNHPIDIKYDRHYYIYKNKWIVMEEGETYPDSELPSEEIMGDWRIYVPNTQGED